MRAYFLQMSSVSFTLCFYLVEECSRQAISTGVRSVDGYIMLMMGLSANICENRRAIKWSGMSLLYL